MNAIDKCLIVNMFILALCNGFWLWYLTDEMRRYKRNDTDET